MCLQWDLEVLGEAPQPLGQTSGKNQPEGKWMSLQAGHVTQRWQAAK